MKPLFSRFFLNKVVVYLVVPLILLMVWLGLSIQFNSYGSLSVLTYRYDRRTDRIDQNFKEIHKGDVIFGEFKAKEDNLGIVSVRFKTFSRINDDILIFRIKEKGAKEWYYENLYKVDQFQPDDFFTFGFPIIKESKGKTYELSLTSTKGISKNAVAISPINPTVITEYKFTKKELLSDKRLFVSHFYKKFLSSFENLDFFISSLVYMYPLIFYLLWLYPVGPLVRFYLKQSDIGKALPKNIMRFYVTLVLILAPILINILLINGFSSIIADLILVSLWILVTLKYRLDSTVTFLMPIILTILCTILVFFKLEDSAQRCAIWIYYFLVTGFFQNVWEHKNKRNLVGYREFLNTYLGLSRKGR